MPSRLNALAMRLEVEAPHSLCLWSLPVKQGQERTGPTKINLHWSCAPALRPHLLFEMRACVFSALGPTASRPGTFARFTHGVIDKNLRAFLKELRASQARFAVVTWGDDGTRAVCVNGSVGWCEDACRIGITSLPDSISPADLEAIAREYRQDMVSPSIPADPFNLLAVARYNRQDAKRPPWDIANRDPSDAHGARATASPESAPGALRAEDKWVAGIQQSLGDRHANVLMAWADDSSGQRVWRFHTHGSDPNLLINLLLSVERVVVSPFINRAIPWAETVAHAYNLTDPIDRQCFESLPGPGYLLTHSDDPEKDFYAVRGQAVEIIHAFINHKIAVCESSADRSGVERHLTSVGHPLNALRESSAAITNERRMKSPRQTPVPSPEECKEAPGEVAFYLLMCPTQLRRAFDAVRYPALEAHGLTGLFATLQRAYVDERIAMGKRTNPALDDADFIELVDALAAADVPVATVTDAMCRALAMTDIPESYTAADIGPLASPFVLHFPDAYQPRYGADHMRFVLIGLLPPRADSGTPQPQRIVMRGFPSSPEPEHRTRVHAMEVPMDGVELNLRISEQKSVEHRIETSDGYVTMQPSSPHDERISLIIKTLLVMRHAPQFVTRRAMLRKGASLLRGVRPTLYDPVIIGHGYAGVPAVTDRPLVRGSFSAKGDALRWDPPSPPSC